MPFPIPPTYRLLFALLIGVLSGCTVPEEEGLLDDNTTSDADTVPDTKKHLQWGSTEDDEAHSIVARSGYLYVAGTTWGDIEGCGNAGRLDIFLTKMTSTGQREWTRSFGTAEYDAGGFVAIDAQGMIYLFGHTQGTLGSSTALDSEDLILSKWDSDGSKQWERQWGTEREDISIALHVDNNGDVVAFGTTQGSFDGILNTEPCVDYSSVTFCEDFFLSRFSTDGTLKETKQWGSIDNKRDYLKGVAKDKDGNFFLTGNTYGLFDGYVDDGALGHYYLNKLNPDGNSAWLKMWGKKGENTYAKAVTIDAAGNIFVVGYTYESLYGNNAGGDDSFVLKVDPDGETVWTRQIGSEGNEETVAAISDNAGNIYLVGSTTGDLDGNTQAGTYCDDPCTDIFVTMWRNNGDKVRTWQWGTKTLDTPYTVGLNGMGLFVAGTTWGSMEANAGVDRWDIFVSMIPAIELGEPTNP